jgi:hypothetical protein
LTTASVLRSPSFAPQIDISPARARTPRQSGPPGCFEPSNRNADVVCARSGPASPRRHRAFPPHGGEPRCLPPPRRASELMTTLKQESRRSTRPGSGRSPPHGHRRPQAHPRRKSWDPSRTSVRRMRVCLMIAGAGWHPGNPARRALAAGDPGRAHRAQPRLNLAACAWEPGRFARHLMRSVAGSAGFPQSWVIAADLAPAFRLDTGSFACSGRGRSSCLSLRR